MASLSARVSPTLDTKPTITGYIMCLIGVSTFLSALPDLRFGIGGLSLHPYLPILAILCFVLFLSRPKVSISQRLGSWDILFLIAIICSALVNEETRFLHKQLAKWSTMFITFYAISYGIRTTGDKNYAIWGLVAGVSLIGIRALIAFQTSGGSYVHPLPSIGSRNTYSYWTMAPLGFCLWAFTDEKASKVTKLFSLFGAASMLITLILTLSRSSVLVAAVNGAMVLWLRRSFRALIFLILVSISLSVLMFELDFISNFSGRMNTIEEGGTESDSLRLDFIVTGLSVFIENPLFGVSVPRLSEILGQELLGTFQVSSHNLFIDLLAGTGLMASLPLFMCAIRILIPWTKLRNVDDSPWKSTARYLPILMVIVGVGSLFSNEIIFCPSVIIGLAICFSSSNHALAIPSRRQSSEEDIRPNLTPSMRSLQV